MDLEEQIEKEREKNDWLKTESASVSVPNNKADYVRGRGAQSSASKASWDSQPDILRRRAIVKQNPSLNAKGICQLFDDARVPLTKRMNEAGSWSKAYKASATRHPVEALISRDRKIVST
jgi:hypothetical protein